MGKPTKEQIERSLSDLSACASSWKTEGSNVTSNTATYGTWQFNGDALSYGVFIAAAAAMSKGASAMATACTKGGANITKTGETLDAVRQAYQKDEENHVHDAKGIW